jgi:outer membrane receptor protein involved in Fe transport
MQSKYRATRLALIASLAASGMAAAQQDTTPPSTQNTPAPASSPTDPNIPADNSAVGAAGGPSAGTKKSAEEEIIVTGSRIRRKDLTTPAPVTVISREQVTASGKVSIGDFLQTMPEQGNGINTSFNNGGDGATRVSLRSLGSQRTLVLLNGRRMVPGGTGADASVDLNSIPTAAIERVEVLKDGASAVYGSDAIGGVVNLITRKGFKGTEVAAYGGVSPKGDGQTYDVNVTTGLGGDRGNVVFNAGFYKQQPVWAGDRAFSAVPVGFDAAGGALFTQGSGTIPAGRIVLGNSDRVCTATNAAGACTKRGNVIPNGNAAFNLLVANNPGVTSFIKCLPGETTGCTSGYRAYKGAALTPQDNIIGGLPDGTATGDGYNFQPQNYLVTPAQRISLYSSGDTTLGNNARGYYEATYVNRQSEQKLAAEPLLTDGEGVVVSKDSIYNPFGRDIAAVRRRLLEFGNRIFRQDIDTFRVVGGIDGSTPEEFGPAKGFFYDLSLNYGRTTQAGSKNGNLRNPKIQDAIGPSKIIGGRPVCLRDINDDKSVIDGCVPLDLFHGPPTITQDQVTPLTYTGVDRGINQMTGVQLNTSGELFSLAADRPVALAAGYEYRLVYGASLPDPITVSGETTGNKSEITRGGYHVNEGYGELSIPLVSNVPGAEALELQLAGRVFNYSTFGTDVTYKLGGRWQPIRDVTLRGTYSTAFRAPSVGDLYGGQADNFAPVSDPCGKNVATGSTLEKNCNATGVGVANNGDDQTQLRSRVGGNPALKPETAKIFTAGVVLQPSMVRNLSVTVDYYHFDLDKTISSIGESVILSSCYPTDPAATPKYCDLVQRNSTGRIQQIFNLAQNVGSTSTAGIDLAIRYSIGTEFGRFGFLADGTWLQKYDQTLADGTVIKARGNYDLGLVLPAWKANFGATLSVAGLFVGVTSHFIGSSKECADSDGVMNGFGLCFQDASLSRVIRPYNTWDANVAYTLSSPIGKTTLAVGVNNAFDKRPVAIYNGFLAASDPSTYDFMGRFVYGRLAQNF